MSARVHLVGAGPGDPGLLTVRALELIAGADVVVCDRLIPASALDGARPDAEIIDAGKRGHGPSVPQEETTALLVDRARQGRRVVRLKGGDPFVFGRGGEEALALRDAGIAFEVVPGVTAGIAAPAYAGIPVTHRDRASAVAFVTGHENPAKAGSAIDWDALARFPGTLVLYMGVRALDAIAAALIEAGRDGAEPAAIVQEGTLPGQRTVTAPLHELAARAREEGIAAPAVTIVGPVTELAERLAWRADPPLRGLTVAVTRARAQASGLARRLEELGAEAVQVPAIRIEALPGNAPAVQDYDLLCLTSPNGVEALFARLAAAGRDARALAGPVIACIGPGTARALAARGIEADVVARAFTAEGLLEALADRRFERVLVARAERARDVLPDTLRERGAEVDVLALYRTVAEPLDAPARAALARADLITFTSSSTVEYLLEALGGEGLPERARLASIGPVTSATLREHGLEPAVEATRHDIDGLLEAIVSSLAAS